MVVKIIPSHKVECAVQTSDRLGETPLWCEQEQALWWLDIENPKLQRFHPSTGRHDVFEDPGTAFLGSQALTETGGHVLARDLSLYVRSQNGKLRHFVDVESGVDNRLNDGRVDGWGRFWIGTMDNRLTSPTGAFYCVERDGTIQKVMDDVIVSNGIAFSPDRKRMHFTDTRRHQSWVFDVDPTDGSIAERRLFADYSATGERPDGACFDIDGGLWTAFFSSGRVARYAPDGRIDTVIQLPTTNPTCICFGGVDYRTLYITTATKFLSAKELAAEPLAGSVLALDGVAQGMAENRFYPEVS